MAANPLAKRRFQPDAQVMEDVTLAQALAVLGLAGLMVLGASRGHRRGPLRQLAAPLAGVIGLGLGAGLGPTVGHALLGEVGVPWILRGPAGMLLVGLLAWLAALAVIWKMGKPSSVSGEADNPVLGTIIGCWTGIVAWVALVAAIGQHAAWEKELAANRTGVGQIAGEIGGLPLMGWVAEMEPWPEHPKLILRASRRVFADDEATRRLMNDPKVRALASHPAFYPAWGDVEVKRLVKTGDYKALLDHPKVRALLADEGFQRELANFDALAALRAALKE